MTHNVALPIIWLGLSAAWGSGVAASGCAGSFFGPVTLVGGILIGGFVGLMAKAIIDEHVRNNIYRIKNML